jgi:ABC-2 type transport system permease protein
MRKVWAVVRREYVSRVHTKGFLIGTIAFPVLMVGFSILPILLAERDTKASRVVIVDGGAGAFATRLERELTAVPLETDSQTRRFVVQRVEAAGRVEQVRDSLVRLSGVEDADSASQVDGILVVSADAASSARLTYYGTNVGSPRAMRVLERTIENGVRSDRLERAGISPEVLQSVLQRVRLETIKVRDGRITGESGEAAFFLAYVMAILLYFVLLIYGTQVMTSVIEEKNNRIFEVLASSLSPFELLLGKVLGVGAVALTQLVAWAGSAALLLNNRVWIAERLGASADAATALQLPTIGGGLFAVFLLFFILGFLFYASAFAAVGAACNTVQETQQAATPLTLVMAGGMISMFALISDPNGSLGEILSFVPPLAPFVMPVRFSLASVPLVQVLLAGLVTLAGVLLLVWVAARIYRIGILSYGKKASFGDMLRWIRTA